MSSAKDSYRTQRERPRKTILVVEDEKLLRWSIREGLKSEYRILLAESAEEAFEVLRGVKRLDAVLVDVRLPGMNGLEFVRHVRNGSDLKVFIMTAYDHENAPRNAFEVRADGYLAKPFPMDTLRDMLASHLSGVHA